MKNGFLYTDIALLSVIKNGQELNQAIRFIYEQHAEKVGSYILKNNGSRQDAEDIFQETVVSFIEVVRKDKFRGESAVGTFLMSIARNLWLNELKKRNRSNYREQVFESTRDEKEEDISWLIAGREKQQQFREMLNRLGDQCRKILTLYYYENLPMKEILHHVPFGSEQVVRNKKYKCLQYLANLLRDNPVLKKLIDTSHQ